MDSRPVFNVHYVDKVVSFDSVQFILDGVQFNKIYFGQYTLCNSPWTMYIVHFTHYGQCIMVLISVHNGQNTYIIYHKYIEIDNVIMYNDFLKLIHSEMA